MSLKSRRAGISALLLAVGFAAAITLGQAKPTTEPVSGNSPYTHDIIPEIAKLKPVVNEPKTAAELQAVQDRVEAIGKYALPAVVNLLVSDGQGSGVIISKDGYVLTAGHVSGDPHQTIYIRLSNGTIVEGQSLGANNQWDAGLVKITTPGNYAFMPIGTSSSPSRSLGQWVVAMGHPGGWQDGRQPVLRLGKIIRADRAREWYIQTDCTLIMGDSGGPVFDLDGRVIGINSRIGVNSTSNVHVPIDAFTQDWDRLAKGDKWGEPNTFALRRPEMPQSTAPKATLHLKITDNSGIYVTNVGLGSGSERAGIQAQDVITKFNGHLVSTVEDLVSQLSGHKPGETVTLELLRQSKPVQVKVVLDASDG
jgi:serine protease Do